MHFNEPGPHLRFDKELSQRQGYLWHVVLGEAPFVNLETTRCQLINKCSSRPAGETLWSLRKVVAGGVYTVAILLDADSPGLRSSIGDTPKLQLLARHSTTRIAWNIGHFEIGIGERTTCTGEPNQEEQAVRDK